MTTTLHSRRAALIWAAGTLLLLSLMAFSLTAQAQEQGRDANLLIHELANATYIGMDGEEFTLIDGVYRVPADLEDGFEYEYRLTELNVPGDLNRDGVIDAAVVMIYATRDATEYLLYTVLSEDSFPSDTSFASLGTGLYVLRLEVDGHTIIADLITTGPDDPHVAPATPARMVFTYEDGELTGEVADELGGASALATRDSDLSEDELSNLTVPRDFDLYALTFTDGEAVTPDGVEWTISHIARGEIISDDWEDAMLWITAALNGEPFAAEVALVMNDQGHARVLDTITDRVGTWAELVELSAEDNIITYTFTDLLHDITITQHYRIEMEQAVRVEE